MVDDLDASVFGVIREIRSLTDAEGLSDTQKVIEIRTLLDRGPIRLASGSLNGTM